MYLVWYTKDCNGLLLVSVTNEALTLFMYENYFMKWLVTWKNAHRSDPDRDNYTVPMWRYNLPNSGNTPYGGWSMDEILRCNRISGQVVKDREYNAKKDGRAEKAVLKMLSKSEEGQAILAKRAIVSKEKSCFAKKRQRVATFMG